jgi:hypothetical protein
MYGVAASSEAETMKGRRAAALRVQRDENPDRIEAPSGVFRAE